MKIAELNEKLNTNRSILMDLLVNDMAVVEHWTKWYFLHHFKLAKFSKRMNEMYNCNISHTLACAVTSILSPGNAWLRNQTDLYYVYRLSRGLSIGNYKFKTYTSNVTKALKLIKLVDSHADMSWQDIDELIKQFMDSPTGRKTYSFFMNLRWPTDREEHNITLDRHMFKAAGLKELTVTPLQYVLLKEWFERVFEEFKERKLSSKCYSWEKNIVRNLGYGHKFQALLWCNLVHNKEFKTKLYAKFGLGSD